VCLLFLLKLMNQRLALNVFLSMYEVEGINSSISHFIAGEIFTQIANDGGHY
jgi:hypothetical protein